MDLTRPYTSESSSSDSFGVDYCERVFVTPIMPKGTFDAIKDVLHKLEHGV